MRTIYEANDGTQFSTAEECERYESKNLILIDRKNFLCFDEGLHPIKLDEGSSFAEVISNSYFFICFTKEAVEIFGEKVKEAGKSGQFPYIHKNVLYGWAINNSDCWSGVWEVVEELEDQANYLREAVYSINDEIKMATQGE